MLYIGVGFAVVILLPFALTLLCTWAWAWRGTGISLATTLLVAFLFGLSRYLIMRPAGQFPPISIRLLLGVILAWTLASIPAVVVGFAMRKITEKDRRIST
jgi:hypothetical protein